MPIDLHFTIGLGTDFYQLFLCETKSIEVITSGGELLKLNEYDYARTTDT